MAIQAYGKRARPTIAWADALGAKTGRRIAARLVKGAYWDTEIKRTQEQGLADYPLFTRKAATDVSYLACAQGHAGGEEHLPRLRHPQCADRRDHPRMGGRRAATSSSSGCTAWARASTRAWSASRAITPASTRRSAAIATCSPISSAGCSRTAPIRASSTSSPTSRLTDADLIADPVAKIAAVGGTRHPVDPAAARSVPARAREQLGPRPQRPARAGAGRQGGGAAARFRADRRARRPTSWSPARSTGFEDWSKRSVEERAACLERLADLLERDRDMLMRIAVQEAKKTIPDALAEVREAVDFCRYYAAQARARLQPVELPGPTGERNVLRMEGRGAWVCIAPWNFPLAIFLGQVSAALAAGNSVVAKPASQTPQIAAYAVGLAHAAGIPEDALILAAGRRDLGQKLMEDVRIAGVAFTGSTATAKTIARTLIADDDRDIIPLIAETGGINAMIVDSTALPEQVVQDVITSAFRSAGQRCSALRLLVLQEDVAERTLEMLAGAMDTPDRRRSGRSAHRRRPGDRPALLRQADGPPRSDAGPHPEDVAGARARACSCRRP